MLMYRGWVSNVYTRMPGFIPDAAYQEKIRAYLDEIHFPKKLEFRPTSLVSTH